VVYTPNNHICWTQTYSDFQNQFSSFHTTTQCYAPSSTTALYFLLTPWSTVLLEKLTRSQLVKKFPKFDGTRKVHYRIYKCPPPVPTLSQIKPIHTPHPTSWRSILILSPHLHLGLPSGLLPSAKPCIHLSSPPCVLHVPCSSFSIW